MLGGAGKGQGREKAKREIRSAKKFLQLARKQMRSVDGRGLLPNPQVYLAKGTAGTNLRQPGNHARGFAQPLLLLCAHPALAPTRPSASTLKAEPNTGLYLNTIALGITTDVIRPVGEREAKRMMLMPWPWHAPVLPTFSFQSSPSPCTADLTLLSGEASSSRFECLTVEDTHCIITLRICSQFCNT